MRWSWCVLALCGSVRQAGACECDDDTRDTATILREYETVFVGSVLRDVDDDACGETDDTQVLVHVDEVFAGTASEWELVTLRADCSRGVGEGSAVFFFNDSERLLDNLCTPAFTRDDVVATFGEPVSSSLLNGASANAACASPPGTQRDACAAAPPALWLLLVPLRRRRRRQVLHEHAGC